MGYCIFVMSERKFREGAKPESCSGGEKCLQKYGKQNLKGKSHKQVEYGNRGVISSRRLL